MAAADSVGLRWQGMSDDRIWPWKPDLISTLAAMTDVIQVDKVLTKSIYI